MRGAWQWPTFPLFTLADGILLHELPVAGGGVGIVAGLLIAGFLNLGVIAVAAPLAGLVMRRRRPDLPRLIASDYGGTVLMAVVVAALVALGLAHRPALQAEDQAYAAGLREVRTYVLRYAPAYRPGLRRTTTVRFGDGLFRACVPSRRADRALCLFVSTDQSPPGLRVDPNRAPNSTWAPDRGD